MCAGCDCLCDPIEMQPRCFGVDARQDQPGRRATGRTGCAEDIAPFAARITWCARAGSTPGPFAGEGSLLPDAGFILEPYLKRLPLCMFWQGIGYEAGKVFLKACCAAGSVPGCSGRTERRRKPCLAGYLPIVRSCSFTSNSSSTRTCKSAQRHRTAPSFAGSGPASTQATNSACCSRDRRGLAPLPHRSESPPGPSALQRCTRSPGVWRSIPLLRAAVARSTSSGTGAMASIRRTTRPSLVRFAAQRKSCADISVRVILTAPPMSTSLLPEAIDSEM